MEIRLDLRQPREPLGCPWIQLNYVQFRHEWRFVLHLYCSVRLVKLNLVPVEQEMERFVGVPLPHQHQFLLDLRHRWRWRSGSTRHGRFRSILQLQNDSGLGFELDCFHFCCGFILLYGFRVSNIVSLFRDAKQSLISRFEIQIESRDGLLC